jgi:hypothetical protein
MKIRLLRSGHKYPSIFFIIFLALISFFYTYHIIAFKRPQSVHKWRQSDCASIALNYYQGGMNFFKPETHNLTSDSGTSGKCCTSEIPILYYSAALLYKVFGYHDYIYRIFNTLIFFLGLFFLFRIMLYILKDAYWSIALTFIFFTSPVLVYYGNNFLSNSSALAFSIIGWYYFMRFLFEEKSKWFYISIIVFFFAAAFKVTALFSLIAITGIYFLELTGIIKFKEKERIFNQPVRFIISISAVFLIIGSWLVYAHNYNQEHDCSYFSTTIFPVWNLDKSGISKVLNNIKNFWIGQYFHKSVHLFMILCFLFIVACFRKNNQVFIFIILFIITEALAYFLLQFWTFADHDYYTIDIYILPVLIVISAFDVLKKNYTHIFDSVILKIIFFLFLVFNIYYAHTEINLRYQGWMNDYPGNKDFYTITPYLRQSGISSCDTVISIPDGSHFSLYLMNQKGWTEYTDEKFGKGMRIRYNQDSAGIQSSINKGAGYLIINGINELYTKPYLRSFCTNLTGHYNNILIFNLKDKEKNFIPEDRKIDKVYNCDAEVLSIDKNFFMGKGDSILFQNAETRTDEYAHNGKYSCKLSKSFPFGMTIKLKDLKNGESFSLSVWRRIPGKSKGGLIASSSPNPFYYTEYKVLDKEEDGWEKIFMEFFIPVELNNQELVIYVFNPEPEPVYFDDLEIIRYKSVLNSF